MQPQLKELLDPLWKKYLKKTKGKLKQNDSQIAWEYQVTPALPNDWPLFPKTILYYYGYVVGTKINLMDAVVIGAPWVRIERKIGLNQNEPIKIIQINTQIEEIGMQGFKPISIEEASASKLEEKVEQNLIGLKIPEYPKEPAYHELVAFYKHWIKYNGVITSYLKQNHQLFFNFLSVF